MAMPKGKDRLYEPIAIEVEKSSIYTGILKKLVEEAEYKFENGETNLIDYEELRQKAKQLEESTD